MDNNTDLSYIAPMAVEPGFTLLETIEANGMSKLELASKLNVSLEIVEGLISGRVEISQDMAIALENVTCVPAYLWDRLEQQYRGFLASNQLVTPIGLSAKRLIKVAL